MLKKFLLLSVFSSFVLGTAYAQIMNSEQTEEQSKEAPVFLADYDVEQTAYNDCLSKVVNGSPVAYTACVNAEIKRQHKSIEEFYRNLLKNEKVQQWNNGNTLSKGTFKDMNEQYIAYRDRLCSLYAIAMMNLYHNIEWGKRECIMDINKQMLAKLQRLYDENDAEYSNEYDLQDGENKN